ncbi:DMT family transporter [Chitinibacteraceae bacterium HSL-7]
MSRMREHGAAVFLVGVWTTTALAINWSVASQPFTAALASRFALASVLAWGVVALWRRSAHHWPLLWRTALMSGSGTATSMLLSYKASQTIPSGVVAIIFGMIPLATALFARLWLGHRLTRTELAGITLGLTGLITLFGEQLQLMPGSGLALAILVAAMALQSAVAVKLKQRASALDPFAVNAAALTVCSAIAGAAWLLAGAPLLHADARALGAIAYLALIGSVLGFGVYYWLIRASTPARVAILSLISPAAALWLGATLNDELVTGRMLAGTTLIVAGLVLHQVRR